MRVILLGPAGSGKGTQADLIQKSYGFPKVSTGDLLRKEVEEGTELGEKVHQSLKTGQLVADEIVLELVRIRISAPDCRAGYVLDGYPRTLNQALLLEKLEDNRPEMAFEIMISEEEVLRRLGGRRVCLQCGAVYNIYNNKPKIDGFCDSCGSRLSIREDDKPEVIKERFKIYLETIRPVIEHYSDKKVLFRINGQDSIEAVFQAIKSVIDSRMASAEGDIRGQ